MKTAIEIDIDATADKALRSIEEQNPQLKVQLLEIQGKQVSTGPVAFDLGATKALFPEMLRWLGWEDMIDVPKCLAERRHSEKQLGKLRAQIERSPADSQIAVFCRYRPSNRAFVSLLTGVVGPNCTYKTAIDWMEGSIIKPENQDPKFGAPILEPLGYVDLRTGKWQVDLPAPWLP